MKHEQLSSIWSINKAGVFIEAMELAKKSQHAQRSESPAASHDDRAKQHHSEKLPVFDAFAHSPTPYLAATTVCLLALSGIAMFS